MTKAIIESQRILLRRLEEEHKEEICVYLKDPTVMYAWGHGFSDEEVADWIARNQKRYEQYGYGYFYAQDKETGKNIGTIGLIYNEDIDGRSCWELGYILKKDCWGKGYAKEAAKACIDHAFAVIGTELVAAQMLTTNLSSRGVAISLGMKSAGEYLRDYRGEKLLHAVYLMEKENWKW